MELVTAQTLFIPDFAEHFELAKISRDCVLIGSNLCDSPAFSKTEVLQFKHARS